MNISTQCAKHVICILPTAITLFDKKITNLLICKYLKELFPCFIIMIYKLNYDVQRHEKCKFDHI